MAQLLSKIRWQSLQMKKELNFQNPLKLTCTVSIFVPKPFTPFQRHRQNTISEIKEKIKYLLELTDKIKNVKINYHTPFVSRLEAVFTRGDEKLGDFIYKLYQNGAYMTSWDENIDYKLWDTLAEECGFTFEEEASRQFDEDEQLPWEIIDIGISRTWFEKEYVKALENKNTIPCEFNCVNGGVCSNFKVKKVLAPKYVAKITTPSDKKSEKIHKYRIKLTKENK